MGYQFYNLSIETKNLSNKYLIIQAHQRLFTKQSNPSRIVHLKYKIIYITHTIINYV